MDVDAPLAVADAKTSGAAKRQCVTATATDRVFASSPDIDDRSSSSSGEEFTLGRAKRKPATKTARKRAAPVAKRAAASCAKLIGLQIGVRTDAVAVASGRGGRTAVAVKRDEDGEKTDSGDDYEAAPLSAVVNRMKHVPSIITTDVTVVDDVADRSLDASFLTAEPPRVRRVARKRGVPRRRTPPPPGGATACAERPPGGATREEATAVERDVERKSDEETSSKDVCFILYYLSGVQ